MKRFANFIVKNRWWVIVIWLVIATIAIALSPSISSVESNNQTGFIPSSYESLKAYNIAKQLSPTSQDAIDLIVFKDKSNKALSLTDIQSIEAAVNTLSALHITHVVSITTSLQQLSPNHQVMLGQVVYAGSPADKTTFDTVKTVRNDLNSQFTDTNLTATTTGQESIYYDTQNQFQRTLEIVSFGTLLLVFLLPTLIFKSPFAGLLPLAAVGVAYLMANSFIADAATWFNFKVNQQISVIFIVVLFGIGTDYMLFLLFRYRERLRSGDHSRAAVAYALRRAGLVILSAALVVLASFSALFFAKFGIFSSLAPSLVICVAVMMLAALTLIPALVAVIQERIFWPSKAWMSKPLNPTLSKKIGGAIAKHPAYIAGLVVMVLAILGAITLGYRSDFSTFSQPPKGTESATGYNQIASALPTGVLYPTQVYVTSNQQLTSAQLYPLELRLSKASGVANIMPAEMSPNGKIAEVSVILKNDPTSPASIAAVAGPIHQAAHAVPIANAHIYVGGMTAIIVDMRAVTYRDIKVIFPIAAVFIFIILSILLRSLVAPVFLLLCVGLGYIATLGTTTLIFQRLGSAPGIIFFIPIIMYIFVVAIGTDYNILTMTRLREEVKQGLNPRQAADLTVEHSSATVISAGLILAATFSSMLLAGVGAISQMGAAVAIGVALSAFIIAPLLLPSISAVIGHAIWWPSHRPQKKKKTNLS
ncbi:MAG TPA: MMPL family transporter [Candidatus Saccharimonadales bacterium]|jgi:RND superfamily putative drug exporter|nr:MMPL family transporter [Candidatus Saccharimonadales bacterium]